MTPAFVDIHSHVLHGLDDGAKTLGESMEMLRIAATAGTTDIVATPHANSRYPFDARLIAARINELQPHSSVRIHRGCDFHLQFENIQDALAHPTRYTINGGPYLMVEFPEVGVFAGADEILSRLLDAGMIPIVTHPERNGMLQKQLNDLARWVEMGCFAQVTAGSITGGFGRRAQSSGLEMIEQGLAHFVASDAHDTVRRTPRLDEAYAAVAERMGPPAAQALFVDNPVAVINGEMLEVDLPQRSAAKRWYEFWK